MRFALAIVCILAVVVGASSARAATWTSPDGKIGFNPPSGFVLVANPPAPLIAQWKSSADNSNIAVLSLPNPKEEPLDKKSLELGTVKEINGTVVSTSKLTVSGIPTYTIIASGNVSGTTVYVMQTIAAFDGNAYKIVAACPSDISQNAQITQAFNSFQILAPSPRAPKSRLNGHDISVQVGKWGIIILVIAFIAKKLRSSPN